MLQPFGLFKLYNVWAFVTACYAPRSIFGVLMILFFAMWAGAMEKEMGTAWFALFFTMIHVMIQLVFLVEAFLFSFVSPYAWWSVSCGIWPMYFWVMTADAFRNPNQPQNLCCFPVQIKQIFCPFIWLALFTFMSGWDCLPMWAGFFVGIADSMDLLGFLRPSASCSESIENSVCSCVKNRDEFVK